MPIEILQTGASPPTCEAVLAGRFCVHQLPSSQQSATILARHGSSIRAIAGGWADAALIEALPDLDAHFSGEMLPAPVA